MTLSRRALLLLSFVSARRRPRQERQTMNTCMSLSLLVCKILNRFHVLSFPLVLKGHRFEYIKKTSPDNPVNSRRQVTSLKLTKRNEMTAALSICSSSSGFSAGPSNRSLLRSVWTMDCRVHCVRLATEQQQVSQARHHHQYRRPWSRGILPHCVVQQIRQAKYDFSDFSTHVESRRYRIILSFFVKVPGIHEVEREAHQRHYGVVRHFHTSGT